MRSLDLAAVCAFLRAHDGYLILTHRRPDGDALGSAAALCRGLRALGKRAFVAPNEEETPRLRFLCEGLLAPQGAHSQCVLAVDLADEELLPPSMERYRGTVELQLDHHGSNRGYAASGLVRPSACAAGEIVYEVLSLLGAPLDLPTLTALYTAVATDTGCFRFSNTTPLAHRIAAQAIEAGVDFLPINRAFFEKKSRARFSIERAIFDGLRFSEDGRVCGALLTRALVDGVCAQPDDLDNLSTLLMALERVYVGVILTENRDGSFKASVRSHRPVDAAHICARFGGGGHPRAAGCTLSGDGEEGLRALLAAAGEELDATDLSTADV